MAYNLPNTMAPDVSFGKGLDRGTNLYNMLMQHAVQRSQNKRQDEANKRANDLHPLQKSLLGAKTQSAQSNADWNNMLMGNSFSRANESSSMPNQSSASNQMIDEEGNPAPQNFNALKNVFQNKTIPGNNGQQETNQGEVNEPIEQPEVQNNEDEKVVSQGNPQLHNMDRFAGIKGVPPVQTHYDTNGNLITRYPSGKVTMQKMGPSASQTKANEEQTKLDIIKKASLKEELPQAEELINKIEHAKQTIEKHKDLFGPGVGGLNFLGGPSQRKRGLKTKEEREAWGEIEDLFGTLVGKKATEFSHKGLKVAFDLAATTKPSFEEWPETIISKLNGYEKPLKANHAREIDWYKKHGGEPWKKTSDEEENNSENKSKNPNSNNDFLKAISSQLIQDIPEATPENIKNLAEAEGKTIEQISDEFIQIRNKMWEKKGMKKRL